jgi:hypothetical protein
MVLLRGLDTWSSAPPLRFSVVVVVVVVCGLELILFKFLR